ncbi:MAG: ATP-binding cassette domain-containing protein, partial [Planctomycetes bacterium]|nr:ATP-binding cassette domain-containing protein [Planctomycetota bacterium]
MNRATGKRATGNWAIEIRGLTRYFGSLCAVNQLNLKIPEGCVYGLLGLNGSGKTSTIRMLLGLLHATRGSSMLLGENSCNLSTRARDRIGYVPEGDRLYGWLTIAGHASFQSRFFSRWDQDYFAKMLSHFDLDPKR